MPKDSVEGEIWRPIPGRPNYEVSNFGRIYRHEHRAMDGKLLRAMVSKPIQRVAQIVLEVFVGPRPPGQLCRHLDDNISNNHLSNLAWGTYQDNTNDAIRNGIVGKGTPSATKIGNAHRGRKASTEAVAAISRGLKGHSISPETREKISTSLKTYFKSNTHCNLGKKLKSPSLKTRRLISQRLKGKCRTTEQKQRMSVAALKRWQEVRTSL